MPRGDKPAYTDKQERKADHIAEGYKERGVSAKEAERRAWSTVNKDDGGGKTSGSGRGKSTGHPAAHKGGRKGGAASASRFKADRSAAAKKGWKPVGGKAMAERQSEGRRKNGAEPGGKPDQTTPQDRVVKVGRKETRTAGPDGPDAREVGDTFKQPPGRDGR